LVLPEIETKTRLNVNHANWVKQQRFKAQPHAILAMLEHLESKAFVQHARLGSTKIPKVKQNAVTVAPRLAKYPTKNELGANCHRGVPAKWANI